MLEGTKLPEPGCIESPEITTVIIHVDKPEHLIIETKEASYTLDFEALLRDYGIKQEGCI